MYEKLAISTIDDYTVDLCNIGAHFWTYIVASSEAAPDKPYGILGLDRIYNGSTTK
jgi:uncharacterized protein YutD